LGTAAERAWTDRSKAPGNEVVRLRRVRVHAADGQTAEAIDIRQPVGLEMEFEVLQAGHVLVPNFGLYNEEGVLLFIAVDSDPAWRGKERTVGRHTSTAWIPGNFFAEGSLTVNAALSTFDPVYVHASETEAVAFQVVDSMDGDSARGGFAGVMPGVIRPLLRWENKFSGDEAFAPEMSPATTTAHLS
jgi:lipopolysaccharide transport system ATP-binding protein